MSTATTSYSFDQITSAMTQAVTDRIKSKFNANVLFRVDGHQEYRLQARKQQNDKPKKDDLQVTTSLETLQEMLQKKITPQQAFMKGKLKIKGKMGLALKLTMVLDATRKVLQQHSRL